MGSKTKTYIDQLVANGEISFTKQQMIEEMVITPKAAERALQRLSHQHEIASPARGYYLILTPEFRKQGCLPPNYFIDDLLHHWGKAYYVGLLSASMLHGAAHQQPQTFQVMVAEKRPDVACGNVSLTFVQNKLLLSTPTEFFKTPSGSMAVSTPEATAMDLMRFTRQSGGMSRVATVIDELAESIDSEKLLALSNNFSDTTWAQRLGYLLELLGYEHLSEPLYNALSIQRARYAPLVPYEGINACEKNKKWRVIINIDVVSDLHDTD